MLSAFPGTRFRLLRAGVALVPFAAGAVRPWPAAPPPTGVVLPVGAVVQCVGVAWSPMGTEESICAFFAWEEHAGQLNIWQPDAGGIEAGWVEEVTEA